MSLELGVGCLESNANIPKSLVFKWKRKSIAGLIPAMLFLFTILVESDKKLATINSSQI